MARPPGHGPDFEVRRREIIDISAQLFAKKGYAATGMNEICQAVGLARGALYYYIKSKEDLLVEIQTRVLMPLLGASTRILQLNVAPPLQMRLLSEALLTIIIKRHDHIWCYEHDYKQLTGERLSKLIDQRHQFEEAVTKVIAKCIESGFFREDVKPRFAMLQFLNMHNYTYQWFDRDGPWGATELSKEYCRTLISGFSQSRADIESVEADMRAFLESWPSFFEEVLRLDEVATPSS